MDQLIEIVQGNAPMIVLVGIGFWRILVALHNIDKRLVRVETKFYLHFLREVSKADDDTESK